MLQPATVLAVALLLTGCVPSEPVITPAPEPTATPIFATEEDALAAATAAYGKYLEAVDESLSTFKFESLRKEAEGKALDSVLALAQKYQDSGSHQVGSTEVIGSSSTDMESVLRTDEDNASVQLYVCISLTEVDVRNAQGSSIVSSDRPNRVNQLVTMVWHSAAKNFKVSDEEVWSNDC